MTAISSGNKTAATPDAADRAQSTAEMM
jgi:hypothetical protein